MKEVSREDINKNTYEDDEGIKCSNCEGVIVDKGEVEQMRELERRGDPNAMNAAVSISSSVESHLSRCL